MRKTLWLSALIVILLARSPAFGADVYSRWSFFGGLNLIYNSDGEGVTKIPGMKPDGTPGGLDSAPSPLAGFLGAEFRQPLPTPIKLDFAPSASIYGVQYLWANDRPLPAEIENRTSYVASLFLDLPLLFHFDTTSRLMFSVGAGPGFLARYGFLELGVPSNAINPGEKLNAGDQVEAINDYFWDENRWFYPSAQLGVRYRLATGWGAGLTLRAGFPVSNLWTDTDAPFIDSMMFIAALVITPPVRTPAKAEAAGGADSAALRDQPTSTQP